ncbi:hypothetical protein TNCV_221981 [Trichonephila clavipes]|nr:hypothetical protein TNCV_221981 [Trichonephila clavipes]
MFPFLYMKLPPFQAALPHSELIIDSIVTIAMMLREHPKYKQSTRPGLSLKRAAVQYQNVDLSAADKRLRITTLDKRSSSMHLQICHLCPNYLATLELGTSAVKLSN